MTSRALGDMAENNMRTLPESRIRRFLNDLVDFRFQSSVLGVSDIQALTVIPTAKLNSLQSMSYNPIPKSLSKKSALSCRSSSPRQPRPSPVIAPWGLSELVLQQFSSGSVFLHKEFPHLKDVTVKESCEDPIAVHTTPPTTIGSDTSFDDTGRPFSPFECEIDSYLDFPVDVEDDYFMKLFLE